MEALTDIAASFIEEAKRRGLTFVTAESCTAGALATLLSDTPGAGETFFGGFVCYAKDYKKKILGVPAGLIAKETAVSDPVGRAMVHGALERSGCDRALAITGVTGPKPDEDGNPLGLVSSRLSCGAARPIARSTGLARKARAKSAVRRFARSAVARPLADARLSWKGTFPPAARLIAMLQCLPSLFGRALRNMRAGAEKLAVQDASSPQGDIATLTVTSPAFADGGRIPVRYTADGEGISPPLQWTGVPEEAASLVVMVEDPDSPTPRPMVHAIAWGITGGRTQLPEGALSDPDKRIRVGRNSMFGKGYTPPDPPPGHGPHRYEFEVFALDYEPDLGSVAGRGQMLAALKDHVLAHGVLTGVYERAA